MPGTLKKSAGFEPAKLIRRTLAIGILTFWDVGGGNKLLINGTVR